MRNNIILMKSLFSETIYIIEKLMSGGVGHFVHIETKLGHRS